MSMQSLLLFLLLIPFSVVSAQAQPQIIPDPADALEGRVYELDTSHSLLDFTAQHLGFGRVRGTFNIYRAAVFFTPDDLTQSLFRVVVDIASLDTQNPGRDDLLKTEFFAVEAHPQLTFSSTDIVAHGESYVMHGDLQIRDVSRRVAIPFSVLTLDGVDQWGNRRLALEGGITINRNDFGVVYDNEFWNAIVSDSIRIDISFGAARYNAANEVFPWRRSGIGTVLRDGIEADGLASTLQRVETLLTNEPEDWNFGFRQWYRAGWLFYQQGRFAEATAVFESALQLMSENLEPVERADFHLALAEIAWAQNERENAQAQVQRAQHHDPLNPAAFVMEAALRRAAAR